MGILTEIASDYNYNVDHPGAVNAPLEASPGSVDHFSNGLGASNPVYSTELPAKAAKLPKAPGRRFAQVNDEAVEKASVHSP
jgi:hypothetical protein